MYTATNRMLMSGQMRYSLVTRMIELRICNSSTIMGVGNAKLAHVAHTPTQNGVMALNLAALAMKVSASAAQWMVFAAILWVRR